MQRSRVGCPPPSPSPPPTTAELLLEMSGLVRLQRPPHLLSASMMLWPLNALLQMKNARAVEIWANGLLQARPRRPTWRFPEPTGRTPPPPHTASNAALISSSRTQQQQLQDLQQLQAPAATPKWERLGGRDWRASRRAAHGWGLAQSGLAAGALLAAACLGLVWCRSFMTLVLPPFHSWHGLFLAYVHSSPGSGLSCNEVAWLQCFFLGRLGSANKHARQTPDAACLA